MKFTHLTAGIALLLSAGAATAAPKLTGEARVAQIVTGRVAGAPVSCIIQRQIRSSEVVRDVGVVYTANNGTVYVNRPAGGINFGGIDPILVTNSFSSQLCRGDIVQLIDRTSRIGGGAFGLGDFVPYARPRKNGPRE